LIKVCSLVSELKGNVIRLAKIEREAKLNVASVKTISLIY
jgi:hypothetical protein